MTSTNGNSAKSAGGPGELTRRAMLVKLSVSTWGAQIKDSKVTSEIIASKNANQNAGHFKKRLLPFECAEFSAIKTIEREARDFHHAQTVPWSEDGVQILLKSNYFPYMQGMKELQSRFDQAVKDFLPIYPALVERAKKPKPEGLGDMFREKDYPDAAQVATKFNFKLHRMPVPTGEDFRVTLPSAEVDAIRQELHTQDLEAQQAAMADVWNRLYEQVQAFTDMLSDPKSGIRKVVFEKASDLCSLLPRLNVAEDPRLDQLVREVEQKLATANPEILRSSKRSRRSVADQAAEIQKKMDQIMGRA